MIGFADTAVAAATGCAGAGFGAGFTVALATGLATGFTAGTAAGLSWLVATTTCTAEAAFGLTAAGLTAAGFAARRTVGVAAGATGRVTAGRATLVTLLAEGVGSTSTATETTTGEAGAATTAPCCSWPDASADTVEVIANSTLAAVKPVAKATVKPAPKPAPAQPVAAATAVSAKPITISSYVDAPGSQAAIDKCHLVLWSHHPLWLAGHNWCGFQWMAYVPEGTTVRVSGGAAAGTYVVTGHVHLTRQGGPMLRTGADLVLQTCIGSGTGLTLLQRV